MAENQKGTFIVKINHTDNASWQGQAKDCREYDSLFFAILLSEY